ncbi:membrane protein [Gordoniibacillus kamchatkensis]|uniref:Probable membrane transporter protein n=1 Tax=Gordoniibacillus kamchatkensis TaxID=1590651 RepID=A0ABR5AID2_9BACL|nr:sulfite exporter TauE/SafE family protein [Paenibacillus sp. VKM B-2647]KIL40815.1 membrane protein [Paenibacillus sp. VKM B-2647]
MDLSLGIAAMGLVVGFLVGLTGVGAASLLTPLLVMIGINPSVAVGTDLVYNSVTKLFGVIQHWRQKTIDFRLVRYLAAGSLPAVVVSVAVLRYFAESYHNEEAIIKHALGIVLILAAAATIFRLLFDGKLKPNRWQAKPIEQKKAVLITVGAVLGFIVGLTSIGSGSLYAIALMYLCSMSAAKLVGTDIAHAFLLATLAGLLHAGLGNVNYGMALNLLLGSIPGVLLGSRLSAKAPTKVTRSVIAGLILISGLKLI